MYLYIYIKAANGRAGFGHSSLSSEPMVLTTQKTVREAGCGGENIIHRRKSIDKCSKVRKHCISGFI